MVINRLTDNTHIDLYFHMRNHYKKLRNVKSVIDTSAPQGFTKSAPTPPNSDRSWKTFSFEERQPKDCSHLPNHGETIGKHYCAISNPKINASTRSASTPPRPKTRRHPYEMPFRSQWKSRSQSVGLTSRKDVSTDPINGRIRKRRNAMTSNNNFQEIVECEKLCGKKEIVMNEEVPSNDTNRSISSQKPPSLTSENSVSKARADEHEYLQFLLRITEDIIINNFYTNEDVEKVFRNHVEANRDRLKMEKMEAQLNMLCRELHIPCKHRENGAKNEEGYSNQSSNLPKNHKHVSRYTQHQENCECGTKRLLEIDNKADKKINVVTTDDILENGFQLDNDRFTSSLTVLLNKHSLGRVTECTEPTNSLTTLSSSTRMASLTSVSSFGNITVLPCFEEYPDSKEPENSLSKQEPSEIDIPLTDKEKIGCEEEKFTLDKDTSTTQNEAEIPKVFVDKGTMSIFPENNFEINEKNVFYKNLLDESNLKDAIIQTHLKENESIISFNNTQHESNEIIIPEICTNPLDNKEINSTVQEKALTDVLKFFNDKETQVEISRCDKECNTKKKINLYPPIITDDYILINGPVYVLRTVLNAKENIIISDVSSKDSDGGKEVVPKKNLENDGQNASLDAFCPVNYNSRPSYSRVPQFSRLLNSDYDLTPQRDENTSEKYHHLLVDAATSITNLSTATVMDANLNPATLLLTENYSLANEDDKNLSSPNVENTNSAQSEELLCGPENNYIFSTNEMSSDGNFEIKSYTMPKEVNGFVGLSGYSVSSQSERAVQSHEQLTEEDVSLTAYEIKPESSNFWKTDNEKGISEEVVKLVDIINAKELEVDERSQTSSFRSEKSSVSATNTRHILGKRKLSHPP